MDKPSSAVKRNMDARAKKRKEVEKARERMVLTQRVTDNYGNSFSHNGRAKTLDKKNLHSSSTMPTLTTREDESEDV